MVGRTRLSPALADPRRGDGTPSVGAELRPKRQSFATLLLRRSGAERSCECRRHAPLGRPAGVRAAGRLVPASSSDFGRPRPA
jgi:hypothetical protein